MAAAALALACAAPLHAQGWGGALGLSSSYVLRGITQSDDRASLQADAHYASAAGWFGGLWAASIQPPPDYATSAELNAYAGIDLPLDDWSARLAATHYAYPASNRHYDYDEVSARLGWLDRASLGVALSPDRAGTQGRGSAISYDVQWFQPLPRDFSLSAGWGWYDLRHLRGSAYAYWNAGAGYRWRAFDLSLAYIGTDRRARELYYDEAGERWVGSLSWRW